MKQWKKYCAGLLMLATLVFVTACGTGNNNVDNGTTGTDQNTVNGTEDDTTGDNTTDNGVNVDDILFDTDGDGIYDHTDVDGDGLLEEIGKDADDVVDDLVNDVTGDGDSLMDGTDNTENGETVEENGTDRP
jgi:hypothetical protein